METRNHYVDIKYGKGTRLLTRDEALEYANNTVIPKLLDDSNLDIIGKPEVIEGRRDNLMYVRVAVKK